MSFISFNAVVESRPDVGSSISKSYGFVISSYPIEVLFRSPPESPLSNTFPKTVFSQSYSDRKLIISVTLSYIGFLSADISPFLNLQANVKSSLGVMVAKRQSSCGT